MFNKGSNSISSYEISSQIFILLIVIVQGKSSWLTKTSINTKHKNLNIIYMESSTA